MSPQRVNLVEDGEAEAYLDATRLACASVLPMAVKAAIELGVLEIIARAGPGARLSAAEVAAQLPTQNPDAPAMVDRILSLLASHSILTFSDSGGECGNAGFSYGLAPVCKYLTRDEEGVSLAPMILLGLDKVFMESWYHLKDAVLHGGVPFHRAHGMAVYEYRERNAGFRELMEATSPGSSTHTMQTMLEAYRGFDGLDGRVVVDVGGGTGIAISMIVAKHPGIRGVNFDLPPVVQQAPTYPGVEHVGGDMFECVLSADVIFMKGVLHNWSDEDCVKVLKNCWKALPESGKVISMETILPDAPENSKEVQTALEMDLIMLAHFRGGRARKEKEYEALAKGAGFTRFRRFDAFTSSVMEFCK